MRSWADRWVPVIGVYALILAVSAVPGDRLAGTPAVWSVVGHAVEYAVLAAAVPGPYAGRQLAWSRSPQPSRWGWSTSCSRPRWTARCRTSRTSASTGWARWPGC
jgi:hypothetical protein